MLSRGKSAMDSFCDLCRIIAVLRYRIFIKMCYRGVSRSRLSQNCRLLFSRDRKIADRSVALSQDRILLQFFKWLFVVLCDVAICDVAYRPSAIPSYFSFKGAFNICDAMNFASLLRSLFMRIGNASLSLRGAI